MVSISIVSGSFTLRSTHGYVFILLITYANGRRAVDYI